MPLAEEDPEIDLRIQTTGAASGKKVHVDTATANTEKGQAEEFVENDVYSVFTKAEKWSIVAIISYAGFFSTVSSFIYYPALHLLSQDLSVSVSQINLTVTSYMAVATIAPTLIGDAADVLGRRVVYTVCLSIYIVANIAIALSRSFSVLLGLRILQSFGISGMNL